MLAGLATIAGVYVVKTFRIWTARNTTLIIALAAGIILGTAAYIAISAMMLGFQSFIVDQLVNNAPVRLCLPKLHQIQIK